MAISKAVLLDKISRIIGYQLLAGNFQTVSPNLPQRIAILAEANYANQGALNLAPYQISSAQDAAQTYGYGSPIHIIARILYPVFGGGATGIPVVVYPQLEAVGSVAKVMTITVTGTATASGKHTVLVAGRDNVDGSFYDVNIVAGDTPTIIAGKIRDAMNNVLGCPMVGTSSVGVATGTAKWNGLTSNDISLGMNTNGNSLGVTYAVALSTAGSGTPSVASALQLFQSDWNTIVINSYGTSATSVMTTLEQFNGIPNANPTGRYVGIVWKPFIAFTGSILDDPSSITDGRLAEVTNAICPAPNSLGLPMEAAANMAALYAPIAVNSPELDVNGQAYPDMPTPATIGSMSDYNNRDTIVKKGCSTVDLIAGAYVVQDFVTTYHPLGENPPQFRYVRNLLGIDFNVKYTVYLLEQIHVVGKVLANDDDVVETQNVIKPKQWIQILSSMGDDLGKRGLIVDVEFLKDGIQTGIGATNPDRFESFFPYKRSGIGRIVSTTAQAGFNFGVLN